MVPNLRTEMLLIIEAARTMLADSFLPNTFWAEAVSTACYILNRVLVTKPHNKTPYELLTDNIDHMETEDAQSEGRTREMVDEDKEIDEVRLSTEDGVSTDKPKVSTDKPKVSTDGSKVSADDQVEGTEQKNEGSEKIFESTEEPREGTEEKVESTAGPFESTKDQPKEEIATQAS
ncbi:putative ribonuclease H-like domain-containing protein [Tanacetum coccineum]